LFRADMSPLGGHVGFLTYTAGMLRVMAYLDTPARFATKIAPQENGCWHWTGHIDRWGYGTSGRVPGTKSRPEHAHRRAWRLFVGEVPRGLHLHHKCRNKRCVNPDHLEPLTPSEHVRAHWTRDVCVRGHSRALHTNPSGDCRVCDRDRKRRARRAARFGDVRH
jgi:hypothetical protein